MGITEPVVLPSGASPLFFKSESLDNSITIPNYRFIKVTASIRDLESLDIHYSLVTKIKSNAVMHSKIFGGIAIPFDGAALPPGTFKVVM